MLVSKRMIAVALSLGLVAGALAMPAEAAKKKKKKAPQPVPTVLFLDGESSWGEEDQRVNGTYLKLTAEAGSGEKSAGLPSYSVGPNNSCAGNSFFPVFVGEFSGTITGDLKISFGVQSTPSGKVDVRVWPDLAAQACNEEYPEPAASVEVDLPTGKEIVEAVIEDVQIEASAGLMIQLTAVAGKPNPPDPTIPPFYGRAYYGTEETKVEFECLPPEGATTCV